MRPLPQNGQYINGGRDLGGIAKLVTVYHHPAAPPCPVVERPQRPPAAAGATHVFRQHPGWQSHGPFERKLLLSRHAPPPTRKLAAADHPPPNRGWWRQLHPPVDH